MTRKSYHLIANALRNAGSRNPDPVVHQDYVNTMARYLKETNPRFSVELFTAACLGEGLDHETR